MNLLLVEDNDEDAELLSHMLSQEHIGTIAARAGSLQDARALLSDSNKIDLILLGLDLPDSRGLSTIMRIHSLTSRICPWTI